MSHTLHKPTTSQSGCQAVVPAAQPPVGNRPACSPALLTDHSSSSSPHLSCSYNSEWFLPTARRLWLPWSSLQCQGSPTASPGQGHWPRCRGVGHCVLQDLQQEAEYFVFCYVTLQMRWYLNSSGQSMEGKDCLCPDKKTVSKNKKFGREGL